MRDFVIGLDMDRVIFDTNQYVKDIESELLSRKTSLKKIFKKGSGRKDIGILFRELSTLFGKKDAELILFGRLNKYVDEEIRDFAIYLISNGAKVMVISVGDKYQGMKIVGFPCSEIILVSSDFEKVEKAVLKGVNVFVDDKASVVEEMKKRGIEAFQALWFLDKEHQKEVTKEALTEVSGFKTLAINLLNKHFKSDCD